MCGRYVLEFPDAVAARFGVRSLAQSALPNLNVVPTQIMPVVVTDTIELMQWGLVPSWWNKPLKEKKFSTFNARADGLQSSRIFQRPLRTQRCIVPMSAFIEWKKVGSGKQPYEIKRQDQALFGVAGLYDIWRTPEGVPQSTYTVITTEPNAVMQSIHHRMPAMLQEEDEALWLNPDETEFERVLPLLRPYPDALLQAEPTQRDLRVHQAS